MKCNDLLTDFARCKKGVPVARLFRYYFCEGDHNRCPLKTRRGSPYGLRRDRRLGPFSTVGSRS